LIVHILEERERPRPVLQLRLYPYMLERRIDVEGHHVRCVQPLQAFEILGPDSFHDLVNLLPDLGFVFLALRGHRYPSLPIGVESWLLPVRPNSYRECQARGLEEGPAGTPSLPSIGIDRLLPLGCCGLQRRRRAGRVRDGELERAAAATG